MSEQRGIARIDTVVLDCPDPLALAQFYSELIGRDVVRAEPDWVQLEGPAPALAFQLAPDHVAPGWPDGPPQQVHVDLIVSDFAEPHRRVLALGATALDPTAAPADGDRRDFRVYADPAGHPFCLCRG